jgi:transposase
MKIHFSKSTIKRLEKELSIANKLNNLRLYKITKSLLLIADGVDKKYISQLFHVSTRTIYNWLARFIANGFAWLTGHHFLGRGRKAKLSKEQKTKLYNIVESGPLAYGFDCGVWNCAMILDVIQREFNVSYNPRYLSRLLKSIGLSYQKACFVSDHLDEEKRKQWVEITWPNILKKAKQKNAVILFGDEVSFAQWGSLAKTWAPIGKQPKIKTTGKRKGLKMFGAIEFFKGNFHYMETDRRFNGESYLQFLKRIVAQYSCPIILIEDGAPYHNNKIVKEYQTIMAQQELLFVERLPSYSPDYNPIEKLWKKTKKDATHLKYFPDFDSLRLSVINAFDKYMRDATQIIPVMKKLRNDAKVNNPQLNLFM